MLLGGDGLVYVGDGDYAEMCSDGVLRELQERRPLEAALRWAAGAVQDERLCRLQARGRLKEPERELEAARQGMNDSMRRSVNWRLIGVSLKAAFALAAAWQGKEGRRWGHRELEPRRAAEPGLIPGC